MTVPVRALYPLLQHALEHLAGQKANILGEHAKDETVDEVRDALRIMPCGAQALRQPGELSCRLLGKGLACLPRLQPVRIGEDRLQQGAVVRLAQLLEPDPMNLVDGVRPVGVNLEGPHVGGHEQRGILKGDCVLLELA